MGKLFDVTGLREKEEIMEIVLGYPAEKAGLLGYHSER